MTRIIDRNVPYLEVFVSERPVSSIIIPTNPESDLIRIEQIKETIDRGFLRYMFRPKKDYIKKFSNFPKVDDEGCISNKVPFSLIHGFKANEEYFDSLLQRFPRLRYEHPAEKDYKIGGLKVFLSADYTFYDEKHRPRGLSEEEASVLELMIEGNRFRRFKKEEYSLK